MIFAIIVASVAALISNHRRVDEDVVRASASVRVDAASMTET